MAEKPSGERTLHEISQLGPCAYVDGRELLADRQKREAFVRDIFYVEVPEAATPTAVIEPPPVIEPPVMRAPATKSTPAMATFPMAYFAFDKSGLNGKARSMLDQVAGEMDRNSGMRIYVGGHTDSTGSAAYNQNLSDRRAKAAYDYLRDKGIAADRMQTVGYGERMPKVSNITAEGRAINRRVEVTIRN
ncbi:MAG: OmpA family protein [Desulfobacterales bacterium]|nr:OmpA family protein [Desulfobacterales bacterium]MCF8080955.1 OmpA family protein [Desulfobacterales bacterium]